MSSDLIFLIGRQRSGTTVFRNMLSRHGALDCDEIFHGDPNPDFPLRFYEFVSERLERDPKLIHPLRHRGQFYAYIDELRKIANGRKLALDVKYFALNLIPQEEDITSDSPFILKYMHEKRANVVHIVRRNKLRIFVSEQMACTTGKWSVKDPSSLSGRKPKITLDLDLLDRFISRQIILDNIVGDMLDRDQDVTRLFYDEMFDDSGNFSAATRGVAAKLMNLDAVDATPGNLKMNPEPLADLVENYDDLEQRLSGTPHDWMLADPY